MSANRSSLKKSTSVPYQYYGYSIQQNVFLMKLLYSKNIDNVISLEVIDDIGIESEDKTEAIQVKSAVNNNPVSNNNINLWKTFSNWIDDIINGELDVKNTSFELFITKEYHGGFVDLMNSAKTIDEAKKAITDINSYFEKKEKIAVDIIKYVENFMNTSEEVLIPLIQNFILTFPVTDFYNMIEKGLINKTAPEEYIHDVIIWSLGWVKKSIDDLLESYKIPAISCKTYITHLKAYLRVLDSDKTLLAFASKPNRSQIEQEMSCLEQYIHQLDIIECDYDQKYQAVSDFLRSSSDRTIWSNRGLITQTSLDEFEDELIRKWSSYKKRISILGGGKDPVVQGMLLYLDCIDYKSQIQNMSLPNHFVPGSYHSLSNIGDVGWHPDYKNIFKNGGLNENS